jgi:glyoxylase-like metal-dependent hydrolase (beta-lactamase superfamily II)
MKIIQYRLGQLQANCYFLIEDNKCIIIDPADDAGFLLEELQRKKLKPITLLATHGHFDHVLAVGEIQMSFDIPFYIHQDDLFLVKRLNETAIHFLGYNPHAIQPKNIKLLNNNLLGIADFELRIISTPGHTPGGVCFYFEKEKTVFTGDTLFKDGIGRYDFSYSSYTDLQNSLKKLFQLPKEIVVYPGHGETTRIQEEIL